MSTPKADETHVKLMNKISKQQLLILDELGLYPLEQQQQSPDLTKIIDDSDYSCEH